MWTEIKIKLLYANAVAETRLTLFNYGNLCPITPDNGNSASYKLICSCAFL